MAAHAFEPRLGAISLMEKDVLLSAQMADALGAVTPMLSAAARRSSRAPGTHGRSSPRGICPRPFFFSNSSRTRRWRPPRTAFTLIKERNPWTPSRSARSSSSRAAHRESARPAPATFRTKAGAWSSTTSSNPSRKRQSSWPRESEGIAVKGDVSADADCRRIAASAQEAFGRIDALVSSAGTTRLVPHADLDGLTMDDFMKTTAVNTVGPFQMARACAPMLAASGQRGHRHHLVVRGHLRHGFVDCVRRVEGRDQHLDDVAWRACSHRRSG
jgi:hypothetical protein